MVAIPSIVASSIDANQIAAEVADCICLWTTTLLVTERAMTHESSLPRNGAEVFN